jgi:hypothetical protein
VKLQAVQEKKSKLFRLHYCFDMGKLSRSRLAYWQATCLSSAPPNYTLQKCNRRFTALACTFLASCQDDHFYLTLSGLEESFEEGVALLEQLLKDAQPNPSALENLVADTLLRRENAKPTNAPSWERHGQLRQIWPVVALYRQTDGGTSCSAETRRTDGFVAARLNVFTNMRSFILGQKQPAQSNGAS